MLGSVPAPVGVVLKSKLSWFKGLYARDTITLGQSPGRVVSFVGGETRNAVLERFRITGAQLVGQSSPVVPPSTGGILISGASPTIRACLIENNTNTFNGYFGGGIHVVGGAPLISDCVVKSNRCGVFGLFSSGRGGGIAISGGASAVVRRTIVTDNESAGYGGGISISGSSNVRIESCAVDFNRVTGDAGGYGGGVGIEGSIVLITSTSVSGNNNTGFVPQGGGIAIAGNTGSTVDLVNVTVAGNVMVDYNPSLFAGMTNGSGISPPGFPAVLSSVVRMTNSIVWQNFYIAYGGISPIFIPTAPQIANSGSLALMANSTVQGSTPSGTNNNLDPLLSADFKLSAGSPAIDSGSSATFGIAPVDQSGDPRILGAAIDRGADEFGTVGGTIGNALDGNVVDAGNQIFEVLLVNGSDGGADRKVDVGIAQAIALQMTPPGFFGSTPYVLLAKSGAIPDFSHYAASTCVLAFTPPMLGLPSDAIVLTSSIVGFTAAPTPPMPLTLSTSTGLPFAVELVLQAVIVDPAGVVLATNGIVRSIQ